MQSKRSTEQLILEAAHEILRERDFSRTSVRDIAQTAGVSTRAFYNHFPDKHMVVTRIYTDRMAPYIMSSLEEWFEQRSLFLVEDIDFFQHTILYSRQNSLAEAIKKMEYDKLVLHIDRSVDPDSILMKEIRQGIVYSLSGQMGLYTSTFRDKFPITREEYESNYACVWNLMARWMPAVVLEHLDPHPGVPSAHWDNKLERIIVA